MSDDPRLPAVRDQLARTAGELARHLSARDVGVSFIAVGTTALRQAHGHAEAMAILRDLADALERQEARP